MLLLFTVGLNAQSSDVAHFDGNRLEVVDGDLLINTDRYDVIDEEFLYILSRENLWLPLWRADQLEIYTFGAFLIPEGSVGRGVYTQDMTQLNHYTNETRLVRAVKIYETWYFHSGTSDPEYGYRLGMTDTEDNGGRHDTSEQDVINRAANLRLSSGQEIGVYRFTRITYDALIRNSDGRWVNVPGLDRITIHTPYELIHRY